MTALVQHAHDWGFVSGRVAALERGLLTTDFFLSLLAHNRTEDILRQLQESTLRDVITAASGWEDWSATIDHHFYQQVASLRKDCPDARIPDLFLLQGDYQNLKRALTGQAIYPFQHAVLTSELLNAASAGDFYALPEPYRQTALEVSRIVEERTVAEVDPLLDAAYLRHLLSLAHAVNVPLITEYFDTYILMRCIVLLWRSYLGGKSLSAPAAQLLPLGNLTQAVRDLVSAADPKHWAGIVPGPLGQILGQHAESGEIDAPQRFEHEAQEFLAGIARRGLGQVFGPERVFEYLCALANDAYNLKLTVCGRLSRIDPDVLKRRLRKTHA